MTINNLKRRLKSSRYSEELSRGDLCKQIKISSCSLGSIFHIPARDSFARELVQYLLEHEQWDALIRLCDVILRDLITAPELQRLKKRLKCLDELNLAYSLVREMQSIYEDILKDFGVDNINQDFLYLFGLSKSVAICDKVIDGKFPDYKKTRDRLLEKKLVGRNGTLHYLFHNFLRANLYCQHGIQLFLWFQHRLIDIAFDYIEQYGVIYYQKQPRSQEYLSLAKQCGEQALKNSLEFGVYQKSKDNSKKSKDNSNSDQDLHALIALCRKFEQQNSKRISFTQRACQRCDVWWLLFTRKQQWVKRSVRFIQRFSPVTLPFLIIVLLFNSCSKAPSGTVSNSSGNSNLEQPSETNPPVSSPQFLCDKENNSGIWYVVSVAKARGDEFKDCPTTDSQDGRYLQVESFDERTTARERAKEIDGCVDAEIVIDSKKTNDQLEQLRNKRNDKAHEAAYGIKEPSGIKKLEQLLKSEPENQKELEKAGNQIQDAVFYWLESIELSQQIGEGENAKDTFRDPIRTGALKNIELLKSKGIVLNDPRICGGQTLDNFVDIILGADES
jgi:hypothetical protein